jgi:hypothetical protein
MLDATMNEQNELTEKDQAQNKMGQINKALGLFICFFGTIVLVSMFFTETFVGKMTNLGAGLILEAIGIIMILRSKKTAGTS